ncbi:SRPBCC family protein [Candidatus Uabimicrobium sp. HlEnr_7]|uniref:SRPBCC family protein n=1 Tax=Candidatus Uabimicrobium helgolandensis TaxID=3095367 RepID=UPI0035586C52
MFKPLLKTYMAIAISGIFFASCTSTNVPETGVASMPPRIIGVLNVDQFTQAPLQVAYTAHLEAAPQKVFDAVSSAGLTKGHVIKSDVKGGILAWSGVEGHLGVIHLMMTPDGGTGISWSSFFSHKDAKNMNVKKMDYIETKVNEWIGKYGGRFTGAAYGTEQLSIISDVVIDIPADKVWAASADNFGSVDQWSSTVGKVDGYGSGADAGRTCYVNMPGNPSVDEKIVSYNKKNMTFTYTIAGAVMPPFVTNALNTWTLKDLGNGKTHVRAHMKIHTVQGAPAPAVGMVKGQFFQMLSMGMEEFDYYVEIGNPHPRKQTSIEIMKKQMEKQ